jgi:hypothetical protein
LGRRLARAPSHGPDNAADLLAIEGDDTVDLRKLDLDDLLDRFRRADQPLSLRESQETYEARVRKTINIYIKYFDRDPTWKQVAAGKGPRPKKSTPAKSFNGTTPPVEEETLVVPVAHTPAARVPVEDEHTVTVPVPLSWDGVHKATLIMPIDLSDKEARSGVANGEVATRAPVATDGEGIVT